MQGAPLGHGGGPWGQVALRAALWSNFGHYRADRIIPYCRDLQNESAAASVYEMLTYWPEAVSCHLEAYAAWVSNQPELEDETYLEALTPVLSPLVKASMDGKRVISIEPMTQVRASEAVLVELSASFAFATNAMIAMTGAPFLA